MQEQQIAIDIAKDFGWVKVITALITAAGVILAAWVAHGRTKK